MERFYEKFCEVQFLCHEGEPNWLGWFVISVVAIGIYKFFYSVHLEAKK